jgi:hypothetical protein
MQIPVEQYAAPRSNFKRPLLLPGRALYKFMVPDDLQPDQPQANESRPDCKKRQRVYQAQAADGCNNAGFRRYRSLYRWLGKMLQCAPSFEFTPQ